MAFCIIPGTFCIDIGFLPSMLGLIILGGAILYWLAKYMGFDMNI